MRTVGKWERRWRAACDWRDMFVPFEGTSPNGHRLRVGDREIMSWRTYECVGVRDETHASYRLTFFGWLQGICR
jgi:hypothetical protein